MGGGGVCLGIGTVLKILQHSRFSVPYMLQNFILLRSILESDAEKEKKSNIKKTGLESNDLCEMCV